MIADRKTSRNRVRQLGEHKEILASDGLERQTRKPDKKYGFSSIGAAVALPSLSPASSYAKMKEK